MERMRAALEAIMPFTETYERDVINNRELIKGVITF